MIASDGSREINTICFLMCKFCYWCASYSRNSGKHISICPLCGSNKLQCSPFHSLTAQRILKLMSNYDLHSQDHFVSRIYIPFVIKCIKSLFFLLLLYFLVKMPLNRIGQCISNYVNNTRIINFRYDIIIFQMISIYYISNCSCNRYKHLFT